VTVIVEPDSLSAWLGLAGVVVGALLGFGTAWVQQRLSERKDRQHEISRSARELLSAADSLLITVNALAVVPHDADAIRNWVPAITTQLDRVVRADATIAGLADPPLVSAADKLSEEAHKFANGLGTQDNTALQSEIDAFRVASRQTKA
jgi:hypothetical protein